MSGLYLLTLLAIWLFIGWKIWRAWFRFKPGGLKWKSLHLAIGVILFSLWFGGPFWQFAGKKMYWDAKVREWCEKGGGVKVYETVVLPAEKYDEYAKRNWILPNKADAKLSDEYFAIRNTFYYHRKDPQVTREYSQIVRRSDEKVLGEYTSFWRGGGDLPGFWHSSSFSCYDITKKPSNFATSIFKRGDK